MRKYTLRTLFLALFATAAAGQAQTTNIWLAWDPIPASIATNGASVVIFHTTNATLSLTNWARIASTPATNSIIEVFVPIGPNFFVAKTSNFWGESPFSNAAWTPPAPQAAGTLTVHRKKP